MPLGVTRQSKSSHQLSISLYAPKELYDCIIVFKNWKVWFQFLFIINESVWNRVVCILINNMCTNIKKIKVLFETRMNDTVFSGLHFYQQVCIWLESAHTDRGCKHASPSITIKRTWWRWWSVANYMLQYVISNI